MSTEDEMLDAILANREDRDAYRVYGDMLEQRGDPRGQLIAMQLRADETNLEDGALLVQIKNHLARYKALVPAIDQWNGRFKWKWGFLVDVELDDPEPDQLAMVLDHPSCVALRSLRLELDGADVAPVLAKLAQRRPTIERLVVSYQSDDPASGDCADSAVWDRLPRLAHLTIDGPSVVAPRFRAIRSNVRELALTGVPFEIDAVWNLPGLDHIYWGGLESVESLQPLWQCALPVLRALSIEDGLRDANLLEHAGFMARVARLEELFIPRYSIGDGNVSIPHALLAHAEQLAHLKVLELGGMVDPDDDEDRAEWADVRHRLPHLFPSTEYELDE